MTWYTLANLAHEQLVVESHLDQIRENIEHLGAMKFADVAFSALTAISGARIAVGSYTGDGASTKTVSGVGFQPKLVVILPRSTGKYQQIKTSSDGTKSHLIGNTSFYEDDHIISFNSDGFVVGDGTGSGTGAPTNHCNENTIVYTYIAIG